MVEATKVHPAQRYPVVLVQPYEYVGGIEHFDILWLPQSRRVLMKASANSGDNYGIDMDQPHKHTKGHSYYGRAPAQEQIDLAVAMATCFGSEVAVMKPVPEVLYWCDDA